MKTSVDKASIKILLLEGIHEAACQRFIAAGYRNIEVLPHALEEDMLIDKLQGVKVLGIRSRTQVTANVLKASPQLFAIGCFCIGANQIDREVAMMHGIPVFNAPFSNTRSVAELVIGEMILLYRGVVDKNMQMHRRIWQKTAYGACEVRGKTLGIVGYGHIGSQVSILAESLGMKVLFYDIDNKLPLGNASAVTSLESLLTQSDIITLHVPDTPETRKMIDQKALEKMKQGSVLLNASRGRVVDVEALANALESKHLKGAGIDVFPTEPASNDQPFNSPLCRLDNVFLTPHIGGSTQEAQRNIAFEVAEKLIKYSDNGSTMSVLNFPELSLPVKENAHRILHIHHNQPGVLRAVNRILCESGINIEGQFLRTLTDIGYVVMDINSDSQTSRWILKALKAVEGTIRARVLF